MPGSISIGAFVFGAILILLALAGGGFKLFGAEVSGASGPVSRGVAGVLGLVLIVLGVAREERRDTESDSRSQPDTTARRPESDPVPGDGKRVPPPRMDLDDPKPDAPATNEPVTNARDEVVQAVRGALDAATEAVNEQDGSMLDAYFEGGARAVVNPLSSALPVMLQQNGLDYNTLQSMGYSFVSAFELVSLDGVDVASSGDRADVAMHLLLRIRAQGMGSCVEGRQGPSAVTYSLRRADAGWRVYAIHPQTLAQQVTAAC